MVHIPPRATLVVLSTEPRNASQIATHQVRLINRGPLHYAGMMTVRTMRMFLTLTTALLFFDPTHGQGMWTVVMQIV
jgi:hypothetical protein